MSFTKREWTLGLSPHLPWGFVPQPGVLWSCPPTLLWMALPTRPGAGGFFSVAWATCLSTLPRPLKRQYLPARCYVELHSPTCDSF